MLYMTNQTTIFFLTEIEQIQINAGAIRGTSQTKLHNELGLKSLTFRR